MNIEFPESYLTIKDAAKRIGVPEWKLALLARDGLIPHYAFGTKRKLVRLSEVIAYIESTRVGGAA